MIFVETPIFTEDCKMLLTDESYLYLQQFLAANPVAGEVIQGTGGLRKVRWLVRGEGKRGGVRIIYYYKISDSQIRMLLIYRKGVKDDLSVAEKRALRQLNERW